MIKRCPKCGERMRFVYSYEPGKFASAMYSCDRCNSMKKFVEKLNKEGYSGDGNKRNPD
jgi:ssDNA-binding Zn-finger/Zn-ribbon topoisomerase 1